MRVTLALVLLLAVGNSTAQADAILPPPPPPPGEPNLVLIGLLAAIACVLAGSWIARRRRSPLAA